MSTTPAGYIPPDIQDLLDRSARLLEWSAEAQRQASLVSRHLRALSKRSAGLPAENSRVEEDAEAAAGAEKP